MALSDELSILSELLVSGYGCNIFPSVLYVQTRLPLHGQRLLFIVCRVESYILSVLSVSRHNESGAPVRLKKSINIRRSRSSKRFLCIVSTSDIPRIKESSLDAQLTQRDSKSAPGDYVVVCHALRGTKQSPRRLP
ncbi:hypothetical protein J6590_096095 [Homalodisca vitripennis]|nr:hypothetical protein J6590_096095 [Homalodisca vitripennis]